MRVIAIALLAIALSVAGCAEKTINGSTSPSGETAKAGSSLAYEHTISVSIPGSVLKQRMTAVRDACVDDRFGHCNLLRFEESSGAYPHGLIQVRVAPVAVESLVKLASEDGHIGSRQTRAEDLAEVVADTALQQGKLDAQRDKLVEFQNRKDLSVGDMISLARELASIEWHLAELTRASVRLQQRIETNLLTLDFRTSEGASRWSRVGHSVSDALDSFADGTSEMIEMMAFGLPFLLVLFPLALVWRWLWRRVTGKRGVSVN